MQVDKDLIFLLAKFAALFHFLGILSAIQAVMKARSPQGAIAWALSLITLPYISVPLFWIFGRDRFRGYSTKRQDEDSKIGHLRRKHRADFIVKALPDGVDPGLKPVLEALSFMRFTSGNSAQLCIDGKATFDAIFRAIESAKEYLLIQFFIVRDDELGRAFKDRLIAAAQRGVRVYFLFDEVGSHSLTKRYRAELRAAGIDIRPFKTTKGAKNRFQINFRNHRKIVIADGRVGLVGGHNVGTEYLGQDPKFGRWRDTHVRVEGPMVLQIQVSFSEDWHWSSGEIPDLSWEPFLSQVPGISALVLPSGPADGLDTCCLFFLQSINAAKRRIWITSPYFVPDPQIVSALQLAAMRGVDVRIIVPHMADHLLVYWASFSFLADSLPHGVQLYRYQDGFIHEKVVLIDDEVAAIGTANFDNRSFRLNFEITLLLADRVFAKQVEAMLLEDFALSKPALITELTDRSLLFRVGVRIARLMAPIL